MLVKSTVRWKKNAGKGNTLRRYEGCSIPLLGCEGGMCVCKRGGGWMSRGSYIWMNENTEVEEKNSFSSLNCNNIRFFSSSMTFNLKALIRNSKMKIVLTYFICYTLKVFFCFFKQRGVQVYLFTYDYIELFILCKQYCLLH
jgi:hypothetical protein